MTIKYDRYKAEVAGVDGYDVIEITELVQSTNCMMGPEFSFSFGEDEDSQSNDIIVELTDHHVRAGFKIGLVLKDDNAYIKIELGDDEDSETLFSKTVMFNKTDICFRVHHCGEKKLLRTELAERDINSLCEHLLTAIDNFNKIDEKERRAEASYLSKIFGKPLH